MEADRHIIINDAYHRVIDFAPQEAKDCGVFNVLLKSVLEMVYLQGENRGIDEMSEKMKRKSL